MPRNDQHHSLAVLRTLRAAGHAEPALLQAALLHDAAKAAAGLTLLHRVAIVLLKAFRPQILHAWAALPQPAQSDLRYPFWAHANHPAAGADLAAAAGCDPLAALLIQRHQDSDSKSLSDSEKRPQPLTDSPRRGFSPSGGGFQPLNARADDLLAALQAADDDN